MVRKPSSPKGKPANLEDQPIPEPLEMHIRVWLHAETTRELLSLIERCNAL